MTDIGEAAAFAQVDLLTEKCPFTTPAARAVSAQPESPRNDDSGAVDDVQENDGGKLGRNLVGGSPGTGGTWNDLGGAPPLVKAPRVDTRRVGTSERVKVHNDTSGDYPYTVAAHHLIPGNASLYDSEVYKKYMEEGGQITLTTVKGEKTFTVDQHIGYNVNGSHNGVWLAGSYAIRASTSPSGETWSVLIADPQYLDWCHRYMAAVARRSNGQFHDTHTNYSTNVGKVLEKLQTRLVAHQQACEECAEKTKIPPPYYIKARLYLLSEYLRGKTTGGPTVWKASWMTSDQVQTQVMSNPARKQAFLTAYAGSQ
jgi:hypothetical protein